MLFGYGGGYHGPCPITVGNGHQEGKQKDISNIPKECKRKTVLYVLNAFDLGLGLSRWQFGNFRLSYLQI